MMRTLTKLTLSTALAFLAVFQTAQSATLTNFDSIVSLATNVTKNYTFTDTNGASVVVAVTMTPYSQSNASPAFTLLDNYNNNGYSHLGIESGLGSGDGNWVDPEEGVNFTASVLSFSGSIITNSIQFSIGALGIRPQSSVGLQWVSSATTNAFTATNEQLCTLDTAGVALAGEAYSGQLRTTDGGQYQLSDLDALAGQSIVLQLFFVEGDGAPVITQNPSDTVGCLGSPTVLTAIGYGDPNPTMQWKVSTDGGVSFTDISGATNSNLVLNPAFADNGNQYEAIFTNPRGTVPTTVATLTVEEPPATPVILITDTNLQPYSSNTASAPGGEATYLWTISNGAIVGDATSQTVTFNANGYGSVTLNLTVGNVSGCTASSSTNIAISATGAGGGPGIYASDDSGIIDKFDGNGDGSFFAFTGDAPIGLAFDKAGNLYLANYGDGNIAKYDTNGTGSIFATDANGPWVLAFDGSGNLYVAEYDYNTVSRYDTNGNGSIFINTNLDNPDGLAFDAAGNLYVANYDDGTIWKFNPNGAGTLFATNIANAGGMAFDAAGNLFVADYDDGLIWKLDANGVASVYATSNLNGPAALCFDSAGNLYAANDYDGTIAKFPPGGGASTTFSGYGMSGAESVAAWPLPPQLIPNAAVAAATLSSPAFTNNQFQFSVTGTTGSNYIVQASTTLTNWTSIATNTAPFTFFETNAAQYPHRYYRVVSP